MKRSLAAATGLLITVPMGAAVPAHAQESAPAPPGQPRVVADELNNPRQLNWAEDGRTLVVAEAGRGGDTCLGDGSEGICYGPTGSITTVTHPRRSAPTVERVVEGLRSFAGPNGAFAVGSNGADALPVGEDGVEAYAVAQNPGLLRLPGLEADPNAQDTGQGVYFAADAPPEGSGDGPIPDLIELLNGDAAFLGANTFEAEQRLNPDGAQVESNPYAVLFVGGDPRTEEDDFGLVADAAANTVWKAVQGEDGGLVLTAFAAFPTPANDEETPEFVPTSITMDRNGHFYVGGLGSEMPGAAQVVKYDADGEELRRWTGFTGIVGVAVDRGNLYVSQIFGSTPPPPPGEGGEDAGPPTTAPGSVVRTSRHHTDARRYEVDVPLPGGLATDLRGNVYVSAYSTSPATGVQDVFGPDSLDLEGGQVWELDFRGARVIGPVTPPPGPGGPVGTNGEFVPVDASYYEPFSDQACGSNVTVTPGDVREVMQRVTVYPTGQVKTEIRGNATVDVTRESDGATIEELDVSGEGYIIETRPTAEGRVHVIASLEGASIVLPMNEVQADALMEAGLPRFVFYIGGNVTFQETLQLGETAEDMPETVEAAIINNTAVGVHDVCDMLDDAAQRATAP